ncbi:MAG: ABC transporter permease [Alphaproteobacteria bacterium]|nr:ABC transporter permease [Alphaproteobacteria bacterium]
MHIAGLAAVNLFVPPLRIGLTVGQVEFIGIQSLPIILLSAAFTGAVFTYESYDAFAYFGAQGLVGGTVGVALTRELSPTLTGLLVAGRAGSAMAAELGSMRVTEQIDALEAMAVDPVNYLVKPRIVASILALPMLTAVFDAVGMFGSYVVGVYVLHLSPPEFLVRLRDWVDWDDIWAGLVKATIFGAIVGLVACYKGYYTEGGAVGVGRATTSAVVVASVSVLVANYFIALLLPSPL